MKKTDVKIKETIEFTDLIAAIEFIVDQYFTYNEDGTMNYTPWYADMATTIAIVDNFIEGIEFEEGDDIYRNITGDKEIMSIVNKFYPVPDSVVSAQKKNKENAKYISYFTYISDMVADKVKFEKQKAVYRDNEMKGYINDVRNTLNSLEDVLDSISGAFTVLSNLDMSHLSPEMITMAQKFSEKLSNGEITSDTITDAIKNAADLDMDKATSEIIDSKNAEIIDLLKKFDEFKKTQKE